MTDPVQTTQQTSAVVDSAGGPGGIIGAALGALTVLGGLWRTVFGTKAERQDATERAAEIALRAAEHADERAERADESHRMALGTCEEQLRAMRHQQAEDRARIDRLEREHSTCGPRIAHLEQEARLSRTMLADLMRNASTPPHVLYTPEDVRAAMAQEDTGP